jgi:hypothetical protein
MNPEIKLVLDALTKRFDVLEASVKEASEKWEKGFVEASEKWEKGFAEADEKWDNCFSMSEDNWERQFADLKVAQDARVDALERVAASLYAWKTEIEGTVDDIRMEVGKLSKHWGRSVRDRSPLLLPTVPSALPTPPASNNKFHSLDLKPSSVSGRPSAADETDRNSWILSNSLRHSCSSFSTTLLLTDRFFSSPDGSLTLIQRRTQQVA